MSFLWYTLVAFLGVSQPACFATTLFVHRGSAHRAVTFHPAVRFLLEFVMWLTTGLVGEARRVWVARHRWHHKYPDVPGDIHSPILEGYWPIQLGNIIYYWKAGRNPEILELGRNVRLSWTERYLFRPAWLGPLVGIGILCLAFGWRWGLFVAAAHTVLYVVVLNGLINGLCHVRGYKNFRDVVAFNLRSVAWLTGGEGLHNNHHKYPWSAFFAQKTGGKIFPEVDLAGLIIKGLLSLRLARLERAET